jgi:hypothetical protein
MMVWGKEQMNMPMGAANLLKKGQCAIVLFTKGNMFNSAPTGHSGNWSAAREFSHVIVYQRVPPNTCGGDIYIGQFTHFGDPIEPEQNQDLSSIHFENLSYKGHTDGSLWDFTGKHARRFCYVDGLL